MDMVYVVNGGSSGSGGGGSGGSSGGGASAAEGYRFVKASVTGGEVGLQDRCVTRVELLTDEAVRIVFPPRVEGVARDFILRLVIKADYVPEVTFAVPAGETLSLEEGAGESFACTTGVNIFAFTETEDGAFAVNRKLVSIVQMVTFDAGPGSVDTPTADFILGSEYGDLPVAARSGYAFTGWYDEAGAEVRKGDTVKASVTRLVAGWEAYADKFAPAILDGGAASFSTDGDAAWTLEDDGEGGRWARSGAVGDGQRTSLFAAVEGDGTLSFSWRVSSEEGYDALVLLVDGVEKARVSGETDWEPVERKVSGTGPHTVEWRYLKDGSVSDGEDCAWVDGVRWEVS